MSNERLFHVARGAFARGIHLSEHKLGVGLMLPSSLCDLSRSYLKNGFNVYLPGALLCGLTCTHCRKPAVARKASPLETRNAVLTP